MSFWVEMLIWIVGWGILHPLLMWLFDRFQKNKYGLEPIKADPNNFVIKQNKDMRGMTWVLGLFLGIPYLGLIIAFPFTYESNGMSKTDVIIAEAIFLSILTVITYLMFRILTFKIEIRNDNLYIYSFFRLRKFDIEKLTAQTKTKGCYEYFDVFLENKKILKINYSMTNYELAKERLIFHKKCHQTRMCLQSFPEYLFLRRN